VKGNVPEVIKKAARAESQKETGRACGPFLGGMD
jgi:hypothetical protein